MLLRKSHNDWSSHLSPFLVRLLDFALSKEMHNQMRKSCLNCNQLVCLWQMLLLQILLLFLSYLSELNTHPGVRRERTSHCCMKYARQLLKHIGGGVDGYGAHSSLTYSCT